MTNETAPERIWAVTEPDDISAQILGEVYAQQVPDGMVGSPVEYVRADALEAAQARIAELEEALTRIDEASNHYAMTPTYSEGTLRYAHKSTRNLARAALEGKGCS